MIYRGRRGPPGAAGGRLVAARGPPGGPPGIILYYIVASASYWHNAFYSCRSYQNKKPLGYWYEQMLFCGELNGAILVAIPGQGAYLMHVDFAAAKQ